MEEKVLMRSEVDEKLTWDLSLIYATEEAYENDVNKMIETAKTIKENYEGKLNDPAKINECLELLAVVYEIMGKTGNYAELAVEVDYYDGEAANRAGKLNNVFTNISSDLSFIETEINEQSDEVLDQALEIATTCKGKLKEIIRNKPHTLSKEVEETISAFSQTLNAPATIYNNLKLADMKFDNFTVNGKSYPLGYSLFEDYYEYVTDTDVRRAAFRAFSDKLKQYENGTAATYNAYCKKELAESKLRKFDNIFEKDLFSGQVTREMYDRQIDVIMDKLAPHMQKYAKLIQKVHGLDKMTYADLKLPLDPEYNPSVTIEESKEYIVNGLAIYGDDYVEMINEAYDKRWVDFAKNQGKSTGGFCSAAYGVNACFILLNWNNMMADVFTLAHELGHAGHFRYLSQAQPYFDANIPNYLGEAPSTMNEVLMVQYLLKTSDDKRFRRWVLSNIVGKTYYHNFVTHLLEAAYQREVYNQVSAGNTLNANALSAIYKDVLSRFWGDAVELTEGCELTWMRQQHYYMGLYSYSYSAGLTVATEMAKRIENEGPEAIEDWKKVLRAGATLDPVSLTKLAKIDITTDAALIDTIETIGGYIDEIAKLTEELGE